MNTWQYHPARDLPLKHSERVVSLKRESGLGSALLHRPVWAVLRFYMIVFHHMRVVGREHLPTHGAFVLIANHSSHLDALALGAALPAATRDHASPLAAKDTFFTSPVRSTLSAFFLNALPVCRAHCGTHALATLRERLLDDGEALILFPEGTRTRSGRMGPFRQGIGTLVAGTSVPVVPCWIDGAFKAWPPDRRRPTTGRITVIIGPPLQFPQITNDHDGWSEVAAQLETAVHELIPPSD